MSVTQQMLDGLFIAVSPENLMYCAIGVSLGTIVGVIPGIGSLATISLLLPITFYLDPTTALIMMAGIFYGANYGGSTTSILLNLPGTPTNAVTCLDGYPMSRQGRAGVALFMTTVASFLGGSFGILMLMLFSPAIVKVAIAFGPAEYFSLMILGLIAASVIARGSAVKGIAAVAIGIVLGLVGQDVGTGLLRFTFGFIDLSDGLSIVALAMGLFGMCEIVDSIKTAGNHGAVPKVSLRAIWPTRSDWRRSWSPIFRGFGYGSFFGTLPGTGGMIAAFMSYATEKKLSKHPEEFGQGAIEGLAGPESANSAGDLTAFIPTLTLGIPGNVTMALMLSVLFMNGITPGPTLISSSPDVFWGVVMSFWIGNLMLLLLNIPMIGLWVRLLTIPYQYLYPAVIMFLCIGVYAVSNSFFDLWLLILFGVAGYVMRITDIPAGPLLLGFVLGPMLEENFRRAMQFSRGSLGIFVESGISIACLLIAAVLIFLGLTTALRGARHKRRERTVA